MFALVTPYGFDDRRWCFRADVGIGPYGIPLTEIVGGDALIAPSIAASLQKSLPYQGRCQAKPDGGVFV